LVLVATVCGQDECSVRSCHPPLGDLMVGRSAQISATSTCGIDGPQKYCIIGYLENEQKCFMCDSRYPYNRYNNPNSHQIENIITTFEPDRKLKWWQSENGVEHVSIQLDLEALFQFSHLVLTFKTFRPAAMLVERSKDNGRTWKVFRYFAQDCRAAFPFVSEGLANRPEDVICDSRYSGTEPSTNGEVVLKALDPSFQIDNPYTPHIQELITLTNLRINFTRLLTLGDTLLGRRKRNPQDKYYYALYEMVVRGSCFCNGHASQCMPADQTRGDVFSETGMVHGRCVCQHNTEGLNCERCKDFYNDSPWRPAETSTANVCKRCNCNGHSEKCHFDMALYLASGGVSGGVCDNCQNNRVGPKCEQCRPFYYHDPGRPANDPYSCIPCDCDPEGSVNNGLCKPHSDPQAGAVAGHCICKDNVEGVRCDRCKPGYYGISRDDPKGCQVCRCNRLGSVLSPSPCDQVTGECHCLRFATGPLCDECLAGYWGLGNSVYSCSPCDCDIGGAHVSMCAPEDGQCQCLPHIVGRRCNEPEFGYFFAPLDYYLYEAEHAAPLNGYASLVRSFIIHVLFIYLTVIHVKEVFCLFWEMEHNGPPALPKCEKYFRDKGYDFKFVNGRFVLTRVAKRSVRERRQAQNTIPLYPGFPLQIVFRERAADRPITWTGPGFVRVQDGAGLRFMVTNLPASLDFTMVIRYEPESTNDWVANVKITPTNSPDDRRCPYEETQTKTVTLSASARIAILDAPVCLDQNGKYHVDITFRKSSNANPQSSHILIDSMGLIPKIESLQNFCSQTDLDEYQRYRCIEIATEVGSQILPDVCERLIASMSARIHYGAVSCRCNAAGSISPSCSKFGGRCQCKPNVIGRCCDTCAPATFGFGPYGCTPCACDPRGSISEMCDQVNGQCPCRNKVSGRQCSQCQPGYFGFPQCRPCQCNGLAQLCDQTTGACLDCRGFSTGNNCERQAQRYYGDPVFREPCEPCLCPESKASGRYFAHSCSKDQNSLHVVCNCRDGYSGPRCDQCPPGFYGSLARPWDRCLECACNNNIDLRDRGSCDGLTGQCLRCLHNTEGHNCQLCKPGYFGSAVSQDCRACSCSEFGTDGGSCRVGGVCLCDPSSGQCPCLPHVTGTNCIQCEVGYWNLGSGRGCQPCDCDPVNALSKQCNENTGQCSCRPEFGGRRCEECGENYFGNPLLQCISCDCKLEGTERPTCDRYTGECNCRPGVVGAFCDKCARGFSDRFPACAPCHPCFRRWDETIDGLRSAFSKINGSRSQCTVYNVSVYDSQMQDLEDKLGELQDILDTPIASIGEIEKAEQLCNDINKFKDSIDPNLILMDLTPLLSSDIDSIRQELNRFFKDLTDKVKTIPTFDRKLLLDAYDTVKKHHKDFNDNEEKIQKAKPFLDDSKTTREKVIALLDEACLDGEWEALNKKVNALSVANLNEEICGAPGNTTCPLAKCGGALCRDWLGYRQCGGPGCEGSLPLAQNATNTAKETGRSINDLLNKLKDSEREILDAKQKTQGVKDKAEELKKKLKNTTDKFEEEKQDTQALIKRVRDFLTADRVEPEDIDKVATYVLSFKLPDTPENVQDMINKIQTLLESSTEVEADLKNVTDQAQQAKELLEKAKEAKDKAKSLDFSKLKEALDNAKKTQDNVKKALDKAKESTTDINDKITQAEKKLTDTENDLDLEKMKDLLDEIEALKDKTETNRQQGKEAKATADSALSTATEAERVNWQIHV
ncbi:LAMB4 protein, partial [Amia calva]|nr:LAMB4 protein [Amia calva]